MPYKSQAQRRLFHALKEKGKMSPQVVKEFDEASAGEQLPQKLSMGGKVGQYSKAKEQATGYAYGGEVDYEDDFDEQTANTHPYDSSGEPHTEDDLEDEHPMEFMSEGGMAGADDFYGNAPYKYAKGGMVEHLEHGDEEPAHDMEHVNEEDFPNHAAKQMKMKFAKAVMKKMR